MAAIITNKLRIFNAQQFIESLAEQAALWAPSNSYSEGDVVLNGTNLYVCAETGVSNSSGDGPTHVTGVSADGTATWAFYNVSLYNNLFMGIGKHTAWADDANPPTPIDSVKSNNTVKDDLTAIKKVDATKVSLAIPRIDWTSGRTYTMYEDILAEAIIPNNYIITQGTNQYNVYKCISNQVWTDVSTGVQTASSTVQPTGTSTNTLEETADGYVWKFMYKIELTDALKFLTKDYLPVKNLYSAPAVSHQDYAQWQVRNSANTNSGAIQNIKIIDDDTNSGHSGGSGYNQNLVLSNVAVATSTTAISITTGSSLANNDFAGYSLIVTPSGGSNQFQRKITASTYSGGALSLTIASGFDAAEAGAGSTIIVAPTVEVTSTTGSGFTGYGLTQGDQIKKVVITDGGTNYNTATALVVANDVPASITSCKITPIISPEKGHGYNPVEELGGYYAMIAMKLEYSEQDTRSLDAGSGTATEDVFPVSLAEGVFRQIIILTDPIDKSTSKLAMNGTYKGPQHPTYNTSNRSKFDIVSGTGKVLYVENRQPVARAVDQIEDIKVVFEF
tara:strand:+ start:15983 stop:17665 length:1683 start_codon:yes stop_codon:yes gene_type:complete